MSQTVNIIKGDLKRAGLLIGLLCILFWPALQEMWGDLVRNSNNSHGILVPLIFFYLVKQKFDALQKDEPTRVQEALNNRTATNLGLIGIAVSLMVYFIGFLGGVAIFQRIAFIVSVQSVLLFIFGFTFIKFFLFPLVFLFFFIPVPVTIYSMVALPMQLFATKISVWIMQLTPLPVSAEGNIIHCGESFLEVAEACSGLRSLMAFIMLSLLFAYIAKMAYWKKILLPLLSVPLAITGNVVRIILTTLIAYIYGSKTAAGFIHDVSGYLMFVLAFIVFFWMSRKLEGSGSNVK